MLLVKNNEKSENYSLMNKEPTDSSHVPLMVRLLLNFSDDPNQVLNVHGFSHHIMVTGIHIPIACKNRIRDASQSGLRLLHYLGHCC